MNEWISVYDKLPEEKTWVEVISIYLYFPIEWFYCSGGTEPDRWPCKSITHWRYITHDIFSPITQEQLMLELPLFYELPVK